MMCHIAKIMKQGNTFRMNVADTKPYNADYDGDEMNMHMPQSTSAETELMAETVKPPKPATPSVLTTQTEFAQRLIASIKSWRNLSVCSVICPSFLIFGVDLVEFNP